ncbi:hypothetical protein, partial [Limnospira platensis]
HFSNLQTVTGEKAIANKVTDSVTLGDAKVKNLNAPLRAIAHNPTDTTPSVPPEVLELESKVLELQSEVLELRDLVKKDYAAFSRIAGDIDMVSALIHENRPFLARLFLVRNIAKNSRSALLAINSRAISGEDDDRGSGR